MGDLLLVLKFFWFFLVFLISSYSGLFYFGNFSCIAAKGEDAQDCQKFAKYYRALCPGEWVCKINAFAQYEFFSL